jgi:DNA-binding Lrp family transcriptional regulator
VLCRFAKDNSCFPSFQTIADKIGCSKRKAIDSIKTLEKRGIIIKENRKTKEKYTSNIYRIVGFVEGGSAPHALGSAPHALGVVHHMHQGSAPHAHKQHELNKTNLNKTKTTTGEQEENVNDETEKKDVVVVYTTEDAIFYKNKIECIIKAKIKRISDVEDLLNNCGKDRIELYLDNWNKFKSSPKTTIAGFFIDAVRKEYEIPVSEKGHQEIPQHHNFKQRKYTEEEMEQYYAD